MVPPVELFENKGHVRLMHFIVANNETGIVYETMVEYAKAH